MSEKNYKTFKVEFEHTLGDGSRQIYQQTITIWGDSEFKAQRELEDRHDFKDVTILDMEEQ